jgi:GGDEF domain-containing protein
MATGMIIDGVLGSEAIDSSGEVLEIEGADISDVDKGTLLLNWEHEPGEKGADTIVGKVIAAKKIYGEQDCENDRQRRYWREVKVPFIYGICRLFDGAGHENAKSIAAIIRDCAANNEMLVCRFSVEGSTLEKDGNRLKASVIRRVAVTVKPCNRTANSGILEDPNAPAGYEKTHDRSKVKDLLDLEDTEKSEFEHPLYMRLAGATQVECNPLVEGELEKAISAGSGGAGAAPSALVGGAALQREDRGRLRERAVKAIRDYQASEFKKDEFRTYMKSQLPEASDGFLDHFSDVAEDYHVRRKMTKAEAQESPVLGVIRGLKHRVYMNRLQALSVDMNHALSRFRGGASPASPLEPEIHSLDVKMGDSVHPAGRFLVHDGHIQHLEDYHGLLGHLLPEGPMDEWTAGRMYAMSANPGLLLRRYVRPGNPEGAEEPVPAVSPAAQAKQRPPSVFAYERAGMDRPHTLEVQHGAYLLDGNRLSHPEVQTVLSNVRQGTAKLRYIQGGADQRIAKMEAALAGLLKSVEESDDAIAAHAAMARRLLEATRAAVAKGHLEPQHERDLTQLLYNDPMTPGLGNKAAAADFKSRPKPGVYINMDGNDFRAINSAFGHPVGDAAIQAFGKAARQAMDEAVGRGSGKLFHDPDQQNLYRDGGDEFLAHVPSHEHAARFARLLGQKLEALPPVGGTHKLSMSFGFGTDPKSADDALYAAKEQKYHPGTKTPKYPLGQVPSLIHSHVPGFEGPVPAHDPGATAVHHVMAQPEVKQPKVEMGSAGNPVAVTEPAAATKAA